MGCRVNVFTQLAICSLCFLVYVKWLCSRLCAHMQCDMWIFHWHFIPYRKAAGRYEGRTRPEKICVQELCSLWALIASLFICKGHELLSELQQRRFNGSDGGVSWSPMDDELLAQPQVMKLLDSLREQYTRYQEVCRQRSKRTQLEEIQQKVMQVGQAGASWPLTLCAPGVFPWDVCLVTDDVESCLCQAEKLRDFKLDSYLCNRH